MGFSFSVPSHKVDEDNIKLLLKGFECNIKFYNDDDNVFISSSSSHLYIDDYCWNKYNIYYGSEVCFVGDEYGFNYNFAYIPSESITTGETNGRKSISFSVHLKYHKPNENDIIKSRKYTLEYSKNKGYYVKKLNMVKNDILYGLIGLTFEYGENYDFILNRTSTIGHGTKKSSCFLRKRCTKTVIKKGIRKGPMFKNIKQTANTVKPGYYQLWCSYGLSTTHITDFVITTKTWDITSKRKPRTLMVIYP